MKHVTEWTEALAALISNGFPDIEKQEFSMTGSHTRLIRYDAIKKNIIYLQKGDVLVSSIFDIRLKGRCLNMLSIFHIFKF